MTEMYKDLMKFQDECPNFIKDTEGFGYKYVTIDKIIEVTKPILKKFNLNFRQELYSPTAGEFTIASILEQIEGDDREVSELNVAVEPLPGMSLYQAQGAGITYMRRYAMAVSLGIIIETDTDGAGKEKVKGTPEKSKRKELSDLTPDGKPKTWMNSDSEEFNVAVEKLASGEISWKQVYDYYKVSKGTRADIEFKLKN